MTAATVVLLVVLGATVAAAASIMVSTRRTGTPPMPVSPVVLPVLTEAVRRALPATERPVIVEAGCGWGTILFTLHDAFPHADVRGVERSPVPWFYARLRAWLRRLAHRLRASLHRTRARAPAPPRRTRRTRRAPQRHPGTVIVTRGDLFRHSFREADLLVAYLSRHHMERLSSVEERLPPVVVSVAFALPGRRPDTTLHAPDIYRTPVYVYRL